MILLFNSVDSVLKRLQFEWFKLLLSVPFLQLEWGRLCSDISFWAVKQVLATRSQLCACIIKLNGLSPDHGPVTGCDFARTDTVLTKERKTIFFVIWTRLTALRLVSLTCEHSLLSSLLSARDVLVLRCQWCARVRWDQETNSFRGTERRVHERGTDSGRSTLNRRDPQVAATICFTHFLFFLELCIYSRRLLFYQCYPRGIALLIVGNTVINYFQIG